MRTVLKLFFIFFGLFIFTSPFLQVHAQENIIETIIENRNAPKPMQSRSWKSDKEEKKGTETAAKTDSDKEKKGNEETESWNDYKKMDKQSAEDKGAEPPSESQEEKGSEEKEAKSDSGIEEDEAPSDEENAQMLEDILHDYKNANKEQGKMNSRSYGSID